MQQIDIKIKVLKQIYQTYHDFSKAWPVACEKFCADCCTRNVTVTSLEASLMLAHIKDNGLEHLVGNLTSQRHRLRYQPLATTNQIAVMYAKGETPPDEESDPSWSPCPFLIDNACSIYPARPFGCRCFLSAEKCMVTGHAVVDPFYMSVHTVVLQTIEHVDAGGGTGNLTDMIHWLSASDHLDDYYQQGLKHPLDNILPNRPLSILMVPESDRHRIQPFLAALQRI